MDAIEQGNGITLRAEERDEAVRALREARQSGHMTPYVESRVIYAIGILTGVLKSLKRGA